MGKASTTATPPPVPSWIALCKDSSHTVSQTTICCPPPSSLRFLHRTRGIVDDSPFDQTTLYIYLLPRPQPTRPKENYVHNRIIVSNPRDGYLSTLPTLSIRKCIRGERGSRCVPALRQATWRGLLRVRTGARSRFNPENHRRVSTPLATKAQDLAVRSRQQSLCF